MSYIRLIRDQSALRKYYRVTAAVGNGDAEYLLGYLYWGYWEIHPTRRGPIRFQDASGRSFRKDDYTIAEMAIDVQRIFDDSCKIYHEDKAKNLLEAMCHIYG